jgi:alkaline phosphatase
MIEGGAVDWASHGAQSGRMIEEQIDFNNAVEAVMKYLLCNRLLDDTLVMVTGDHECGYLWGPGSNPTWKPIVNNGKGNLPGMQWNPVEVTANPLVYEHTNQLIPFFAFGKGSLQFLRYMDERDPVRGRYIDNTEMAKLMFDVWSD